MANTNGPNSVNRDFGRDRAEDRMSDEGLAHNRAGIRDTDARVAARDLNRNTNRVARLPGDKTKHGGNQAGFCPPGQAKKAGSGSSFNC